MRRYLRWERDVLAVAWRVWLHGIRKHVAIEVAVAIAGGLATLWQTGGDPSAAVIGGLATAGALSIVLGLWSMTSAPYRLYTERVPEGADLLVGTLKKASVFAHQLAGVRVNSDTEYQQWVLAHEGFKLILQRVKPLMDEYDYLRLTHVTFNPKAPYEHKFNDDHQRRWRELQAHTASLDVMIRELKP